ncbi:MAG: hypothetical protein CM15mP87_01460 [Candidatus Neomarinimicrobiota bacterium]|nr:MAG: hypothetical protein CM15mP87_01460 [Candidatus Neomarinimicrobiota bacterium]
MEPPLLDELAQTMPSGTEKETGARLPHCLSVMRRGCPRVAPVLDGSRRVYDNRLLLIGQRQTISQPGVSSTLRPTCSISSQTVGCSKSVQACYQAAVLAALTSEIFPVEHLRLRLSWQCPAPI